MPSVEQVTGTLPHAFKDKYPSTFAIIDGSFFPRDTIRSTPSVLNVEQLQAPQYRQVPGSLFSMSPLFVGSIFDVELTKHSAFIEKI